MYNLAYPDNDEQRSLMGRAQQRSSQTLVHWFNRFLVPQGIYAQAVQLSPQGCLQIFVEVPWIPKNQRQPLRDRLRQYICQQVATLRRRRRIRSIQITVLLAGSNSILWKESVRFTTPLRRDLSTVRWRDRVAYLPRKRPRAKPQRYRLNLLKFLRFLALSSIAITSLSLLLARPLTPNEQIHPTLKQQPEEVKSANEQPLPQPLIEQQAAPLSHHSAPEQFQGQIVRRVKVAPENKAIALTFDDGPWHNTTLQVLEILKQHNIKATFFWVGKNLQKHPDIARAVVADGHAVGNHTWNHWYHRMNELTAAHEIDKVTELIQQITGVTTSLFRPPGGHLSNGLVAYAQKKKYAVTLWSVDSKDYRKAERPKLLDNVIRNPKPGDIILLHDGGGNRSATVQALPKIITTLQQLGYKFVTLPELLESQRLEGEGEGWEAETEG